MRWLSAMTLPPGKRKVPGSVLTVARVKRFALAGAVLIAVAGAASAAFQMAADALDRRRFPPPGRLVAVGGNRRLHLYEAGEGTPAVVFVPALNGSVLEWIRIVRALQDETRLCVYDRAGVGWSDPPPGGRRTIEAMAADLQALLTAAGVPPPYILVGHSLGGVIARRFVADHPDQACGLVLVDSSHENQVARLPWRDGAGRLLVNASLRRARVLGARRLAAALGLMRELAADTAREVPPEYARAAWAIALSSRNRRTQVAEMLTAARLRNQPPPLGSLPLTVLTRASSAPPVWPVWFQLQDELAGLSSDSRHLQARHAGHYIQLDEPEAVTEAIRDMITRYRLTSS